MQCPTLDSVSGYEVYEQSAVRFKKGHLRDDHPRLGPFVAKCVPVFKSLHETGGPLVKTG
jgi:hypothetical protein